MRILARELLRQLLEHLKLVIADERALLREEQKLLEELRKSDTV